MSGSKDLQDLRVDVTWTQQACRPTQKAVVRQADINDVDSRCWQIVAYPDNVQRPASDDDECRQAKRSLRSSERLARRAGPLSDASLPAVASWRAERRCYFDLVRRKRAMFRTIRVDAERTQPGRLWRSFDQLVGRGRTPPAEIDASALHQFFDDKVAGVRAATAGAAAPQYTAAPVGCELHLFTPVAPAEVIQMVRALPDKQCSTDPMPTRLLKENVDLLAPFLSHLFTAAYEVRVHNADSEEDRHGSG